MILMEQKDVMIPRDANQLSFMISTCVALINNKLRDISYSDIEWEMYSSTVFFTKKMLGETCVWDSKGNITTKDKGHCVGVGIGRMLNWRVFLMPTELVPDYCPWLIELDPFKEHWPCVVFYFSLNKDKTKIVNPTDGELDCEINIYLPGITTHEYASLFKGAVGVKDERGNEFLKLPNGMVCTPAMMPHVNRDAVEKNVPETNFKESEYKVTDEGWITKGNKQFNVSKEASERNDVVVSLVDKGKRVNIRFYNNSWKVIADKEDKKFIKVQIVKDRMYFCKGNEKNYKLVSAGKNPHISLTATKDVKRFYGEANLMYDKDNNLYYIKEPNPFH